MKASAPCTRPDAPDPCGPITTALAAHEVLAVVAQVRAGELSVLLWQRAQAPAAGQWALPGGLLGPSETLASSIRRHLAEKVDVSEVSHLEQLETRSAPHRSPGLRRLATAYLGLVPAHLDPALPPDTAWQSARALRVMAFDHAEVVHAGVRRLRAKLSYTNLGFALAPPTFTVSELQVLYRAALGHDVSPTNLKRVLLRRDLLEPAGDRRPPGPAGGRPPATYRFTDHHLVVSDTFAMFGPPRRDRRPGPAAGPQVD